MNIPCLIEYEKQKLEGTIIDISFGGAFVQSEIPIQVGSFIRLHFQTPAQQFFEIDGEVVHEGWYVVMDGHEIHGFGVHFYNMTSDMIQRYRRFLEEEIYPRYRFTAPRRLKDRKKSRTR